MRAAMQTEYGAPNVLSVGEVADPIPGKGEVLVGVHASAITQGDRRLRAGDFPGLVGALGSLAVGVRRPRARVPGSTFAGRVVAIGAGVTRFAVGDDVFGGVMHGALAERLVVKESAGIAKMPAGFTHAEAATLPYGAGTARAFLEDFGKLEGGERVLVVGATGGVGRFAVQLAAHLGAEVWGTHRGSESELVGALGARPVTLDELGEAGFDLVLDTAFAESAFRRFRRHLAPRGRYLTLIASVRVLAEMLFTRLTGGKRAKTGVALESAAGLEAVARLAEAAAFRPRIAKRFPLAEVAAAHAYLEEERPRGEVVVELVPAAASEHAA
ncbi:MAG: NAD(P)-dependent alcohol dehydrogenase [Myxococcota bacterium]